MSTRREHWQRGDEGAVALIVAALALVLVGISALAVDLGFAFVQKQAIQKKTDFAALAGSLGDDLPVTAAGVVCNYGRAGLASDQAIKDVAAYLSEQPGGTDIDPIDLVDCDLADGEAGYGTFVSGSCTGGYCLTANPNQLTVVSQPKRVNFGLARVLGFDNVDVRGEATVEIKSPLQKTLPFYAFQPCDYGQQIVVQPTNGHAADSINLANETPTNPAILTSLVTDPATAPAQVPLNVADPADSLVINSSSTAATIANVTDVGFFLSGGTVDGPAPEIIGSGQFTISGSTITIPDLPTAVTSVEAIWYVRVKIGADWSPVFTGSGSNLTLRALPLTVGVPSLTCGQGSSSGNFGTISVPPTPTPAGINGNTEPVAYNIIKGLTHGLAAYKPADITSDKKCQYNPPNTKMWAQDGTNCIDAQQGVERNAAEWGFLTGFDTYTPGLLGDTSPAKFCPNNYPSGTTHVASFRGVNINNDLLTCYFTDDTVTVSQVSSPTYSLSGPVIDQSIYESPRFVSVPVLGAQPSSGSCCKYQIIAFRPGFLTEQPANATRVNGVVLNTYSGNTGSFNGLGYDHGQFNYMSIIFLNQAALPDPPLDPDGNYIPYTGTGVKQPMLVN